jgi:CheY-like chemotaxis protein
MMHLYRIAQEAVSNAVKHGRAKNIRIRVTKTSLTITDDGSGLPASAKSEGMGLRIMRYRAEMIGGTLSVKNGRTKGVVVTCNFHQHSAMPKKTSVAPVSQKRVLIVDDHPIFRAGLTGLVNLEADLVVCGEAHDACRRLPRLKSSSPISCSGHEPSWQKRSRNAQGRARAKSATPVLIISMHDETLYAERVIRAGGRGYIMKQEGPEKIIHAIRRVLAGGISVSDGISSQILDALSGAKVGRSSVASVSAL